jgi:hypothetical protein
MRAALLPPEVKVPQRGGRQITLQRGPLIVDDGVAATAIVSNSDRSALAVNTVGSGGRPMARRPGQDLARRSPTLRSCTATAIDVSFTRTATRMDALDATHRFPHVAPAHAGVRSRLPVSLHRHRMNAPL